VQTRRGRLFRDGLFSFQKQGTGARREHFPTLICVFLRRYSLVTLLLYMLANLRMVATIVQKQTPSQRNPRRHRLRYWWHHPPHLVRADLLPRRGEVLRHQGQHDLKLFCRFRKKTSPSPSLPLNKCREQNVVSRCLKKIKYIPFTNYL
jgi:hypothetical protein